jgi:hypothetical protein
VLHDDKPPLNEATLAHYGVKGMHWGVRKRVSDYSHAPDVSGTSRKQARTAVKAQNRSLRRELEDFDDLPPKHRDAAIHEARKALKVSSRKYEDVRREIKSQRSTMGKNSARIALNKVANEHASVLSKSRAMTESEKTIKALQDIGRVVMSEMSAASVRRRQEAASARVRPYTP